MRDILLTLIVFGSIPFIFYRPHIGVLVWVWLSFMTPHRYTWSFAYDFRFALVIAAVTLLAWLISKEPKRIPWNPVSVLLVLFWGWASLTTLSAEFPAAAGAEWERVTKGVVMNGILVMALFSDRVRLNALLWVVVVSVGFFGIKGGLFTLMTGGEGQVGGPDNSFFGSNNYLAAALLMIIPMMRYLQLVSTQRLVRWGLGLGIVLCMASVLGSQSRAGFIGLVVLVVVLALRSRQKFALTMGLTAVLVLGINFMPDRWHDRMETIFTYEEDTSMQGRFVAWEYGLAIARERPLTGGGFKVFLGNKDEASTVGYRNAHSIYFQVLGEHGYVGFVLYFALALLVLVLCQTVVARAKGVQDLGWAHDLARLTQISCILFLVIGAAANFAYFELYITFLGIAVALRTTLKRADADATVTMGPAHDDFSRHVETKSSTF